MSNLHLYNACFCTKGFDVDLKHGISVPTKCVETDQLLILVHSAPERGDHRSAIRSTWADQHHQGSVSKLVFLIGNSTEDLNLQVQEEASKMGDIFFYNLPDSYYHMTTKHVMGYRLILPLMFRSSFLC